MFGIFDIDIWQEILNTIRKNKLRTFLTGFSVAWGIFMLIILLAAGNGLQNRVMEDFAYRAINGVEVWAWRTSMAYKGTPQGRRVRISERDRRVVERRVPGAYNVVAEVGTGGTASYGGEYASCYLNGVYPQAQQLRGLGVAEGRFINEVDLKERRKVVLINERMKTLLFKSQNPIGKYVKVQGAMFQVVGIYERNNDWGSENSMYLPFTTVQQLFNKGAADLNIIRLMVDGLNTREENEAFTADMRRQIAALHNVHPEDRRAIGIYSEMESYLQTQGIFNGISLFLWIIGIGTLMAGVVGVSNIMLITVRERTREFGIRKALGATPADILRLILLESILITALFGYVGMVAGVGISELVSYAMDSAGGDTSILKNPTVSLSIALMSTGVLIVAGVLAGYFPARKAIQVTAVEAMRAE